MLVSMSPTFVLALVAAPAAMLLGGRGLAAGSRRALVVTSVATWLLATVALSLLLGDPSDLFAALLFYFVVLPCTGAPLAALIATRLVRTRGRFVSALLLAFLGWIVGIVATMYTMRLLSSRDVWENSQVLALPALYASCGAVLAAGLRD